jgi:hypothetical protein
MYCEAVALLSLIISLLERCQYMHWSYTKLEGN